MKDSFIFEKQTNPIKHKISIFLFDHSATIVNIIEIEWIYYTIAKLYCLCHSIKPNFKNCKLKLERII